MKRILRYDVIANGEPHEVPRGVPVAFGQTDRHGGLPVLDAWFEVHVHGVDFDPMKHEMQRQKVQVVETDDPVSDGWRWLSSCVVTNGVPARTRAYHLYEVRP